MLKVRHGFLSTSIVLELNMRPQGQCMEVIPDAKVFSDLLGKLVPNFPYYQHISEAHGVSAHAACNSIPNLFICERGRSIQGLELCMLNTEKPIMLPALESFTSWGRNQAVFYITLLQFDPSLSVFSLKIRTLNYADHLVAYRPLGKAEWVCYIIKEGK